MMNYAEPSGKGTLESWHSSAFHRSFAAGNSQSTYVPPNHPTF